MYIHKIRIQNIRSFSDFTMEFSRGEEAGWHVLIGDNGSGKSSLLRAISLGIIGPSDVKFLRLSLRDWVKYGEQNGSIDLELISPDSDSQQSSLHGRSEIIIKNGRLVKFEPSKETNIDFWENNPDWFTAAFGPMRRFTGGDNDFQNSFDIAPKAAAHLSIFGENVALTQALAWIKELDRRRLKEEETKSQKIEENQGSYANEAEIIFNKFKRFLNESELLPHNTLFEEVDVDGNPVFVDGNRNPVKLTQMSDGYRSVLSMIFELIRQMLVMFGHEKVFNKKQSGNKYIDIPGVVLIDEVDAHLHPTWQTRIGKWFTQCFPNIQFIVTTHSPLICRGCMNDNGEINGSVWQLAAPGSGKENQRLVGTKLERLIFGNILDAYGTEAFGENVTGSSVTNAMQQRLAMLNKKSFKGSITEEEKNELFELRRKLPTGA